jgi:DNA-binding beta-propeller fold protein YncE
MRVVVTDAGGSFIKGYDLAVMFNFNDQQRADSGIEGFTVDNRGNMLFTISALGTAVRCSQDGTVNEFGRRGSGPGKFGVPCGIASDKAGNLLVTDKLRGVVLIFDKDLKFVREFGIRGLRPGNLIVPNEITVDTTANRVYVSQMRRRGVNIYQLSYGE